MRRTIAVLNARASVLNNQNKAQVIHQQEASIHTSNAVKHWKLIFNTISKEPKQTAKQNSSTLNM